jgi:hypothetical protein
METWLNILAGIVGGAFTLGVAVATQRLKMHAVAKSLEDYKVEHGQIHSELKQSIKENFALVAEGQRDLKHDVGASLADVKELLSAQRATIDDINAYLRNGKGH